MSARVPAWKRLGLKLKGPASDEGPTPSSGGPNAGAKHSAQIPNAHQTRVNGSPAGALKRNWQSSNPVSAHTPQKKPRRDEQNTPSSLRKSVSFADGTKETNKTEPKKKKEKKKKVKKTSDTTKPDTDLEPSLNYLRQWHTARESWKFNKNHQTLLIKYFFDGDKVPSSDTATFYEYIQDLKGFVRTRLRETAAEIKQKDMAEGAGAFPAKIKDKEGKQKEYEETIARFLQELQQHQKDQNGSSRNTNGKRTLDEVEYVLRTTTPEVKQRLLKRIRAELVVDELSDDESTTSTVTTTTTSSSSTEPAANKSRQSDGSQQPAKRRRLRNVRTDVGDDDSSSSESDSEGEADDSSSSSSDESEDEEMENAPEGNGAESSSSSSSSSSESESESAAESDGEGESSSSSDSE